MPKIVDKQKRREEILAGSAAVFAARGYHDARMTDVAAALGISKGLLYEYFPSKQELFLALCGSIVPWIEDRDAAGANPPTRALADAIGAVARSYERSRDFFPILSEFWSTVARGPSAQRDTFLAQGARFYETPRALLVSRIARGQETGAFRRDADAAVVANVIVAAIEGLRLQHTIDSRRARKKDALEQLTKMVLRDLVSDAKGRASATVMPSRRR